MNLIQYAESQMAGFESVAFNPVDSLILSQFSYIHFDRVVPYIVDSRDTVRIGDLLKAEHISHMLDNVRDPKSNRKLLLALGMSPRFRNIRMCCFSDNFNVAEQKQFAAVTFLLDDQTAYVAYRGTDSTVVGWKEDFNMAYISPVPAQEEGVAYLNAVAERFSHKLMVGGHSKGGNIAVYSSMECHPSVKERIMNIYSHDGPGFKEEIFKSENYASIEARIHKTLPQSSLIGMLLQYQEDYVVVESKQFGIMQHDPFSWVIAKDDFQYTQGITNGAAHINTAIHQWLSSLENEKRELFITTVYSVIDSMGVVNFNDFTDDWYRKTVKAMETAKGIDPETKKFVYETIGSLLALYVKTLRFPFKATKKITDNMVDSAKL